MSLPTVEKDAGTEREECEGRRGREENLCLCMMRGREGKLEPEVKGEKDKGRGHERIGIVGGSCRAGEREIDRRENMWGGGLLGEPQMTRRKGKTEEGRKEARRRRGNKRC